MEGKHESYLFYQGYDPWHDRKNHGTMAANLTVKRIILQTEMDGIVKQQPQMLKQDFADLLNTVCSLDAEASTTSQKRNPDI